LLPTRKDRSRPDPRRGRRRTGGCEHRFYKEIRMNRLCYPILASLLLLSGQAMAGNDFCDNALGTDPVPPDPNGGGCEVNLALPRPGAGVDGWGTDPHLLRLRDMPFNQSLYAALSSSGVAIATPEHLQIDFTVRSASLGSSSVTDTEAALVEWSFESQDKSIAGRMLALSLRREGRDLVLNMDWVIPPGRGWSSATQPGIEPLLVDNQRIKLGEMLPDSAQFARLPWLYLKRDGRSVLVGLRDSDKPVVARFELPEGQWRPIRLRNGLLRDAQMFEGMEVHLSWPSEFRDVDVDARFDPGEAPVDPPESPQPMAVQ
jgi:hypothetical protein